MNTKKHTCTLTNPQTKETRQICKKDIMLIKDVIYSELYESTKTKKCIGISATYKNITAPCTYISFTVNDFFDKFTYKTYDNIAKVTIAQFKNNNLIN